MGFGSDLPVHVLSQYKAGKEGRAIQSWAMNVLSAPWKQGAPFPMHFMDVTGACSR
jgi:hypothetical protein